MKFRGHETFAIRKGWLTKGMRNVDVFPDVFVSREVNPMDSLGIGSNMVKSLRYWLQATGLTIEPKSGRRNQQFTELGNIIYHNDRYFEEVGTLWLVHYALATNVEEATSWYIFFNEFDLLEFTEEDFSKRVKKYLSINNPEYDIPSERAISDDFKCIINTYYSKKYSSVNSDKENPEDNMECPLAELGLVEFFEAKKHERVFRKRLPKSENIPELIVLAVILKKYGDMKEIRISSLQNDICSIGKVFCLDTLSLHNILYKLDSLGYIKVVRTAGLDVIRIKTNMTFIECVELYYHELNDR